MLGKFFFQLATDWSHHRLLPQTPSTNTSPPHSPTQIYLQQTKTSTEKVILPTRNRYSHFKSGKTWNRTLRHFPSRASFQERERGQKPGNRVSWQRGGLSRDLEHGKTARGHRGTACHAIRYIR